MNFVQDYNYNEKNTKLIKNILILETNKVFKNVTVFDHVLTKKGKKIGYVRLSFIILTPLRPK